MISDDKVAEVRERTDVVALIGEHVSLKRAGSSFKGLCPFHAEKTPSFYVNPAKQFFHCFGCGASGDPIAFVMRLDGRTFPDAVRFLAERAGIEIAVEDAREEAASARARMERDRLLAITEAAAGFYLRMLAEHPLGAMARHEIDKRGMTRETAATYRLGYAPHGWDLLGRFLAERGHSRGDAEHAGLLVPRRTGDGHYDRFRHRLMFPISDVHGRIVGFSGRVLPPPPDDPPPEGQEPPAKYVNSPEGPLYKKGELLFGLHEARVELRREGIALLCEGNFDVLALHQAGCKNVVAPLGTAFTAQQAKLLRRYAAKVVLVFDGDRAGRKAVHAAYPILAEQEIAASVATLPPGEDPDSYLRARGAEALRAVIAGALPIVQYLIESAAADAGSDPSARAAAIESLAPALAAIPSPVERRLWVERIAQVFEVRDLEAVRRELQRGLKNKGAPRRPEPPPRPAPAPLAPMSELEKEAVGLVLDQPDLLAGEEGERLEEVLTNADLRAIVRTAARMIHSTGALHAASLLGSLPTDPGEGPNRVPQESGPQESASREPVISAGARDWVAQRLAVTVHEDREGAEQFLKSALLPKLQAAAAQREMAALTAEAARARRAGEHELADEMTRRLAELARRVSSLRKS